MVVCHYASKTCVLLWLFLNSNRTKYWLTRKSLIWTNFHISLALFFGFLVMSGLSTFKKHSWHWTNHSAIIDMLSNYCFVLNTVQYTKVYQKNSVKAWLTQTKMEDLGHFSNKNNKCRIAATKINFMEHFVYIYFTLTGILQKMYC